MSDLIRQRIKLSFDVKCCGKDKSIWSKSWYLVDPHRFRTIYELANEITSKFLMLGECNVKIAVKLDDAVLPMWESVCILRENDEIRISGDCEKHKGNEPAVKTIVKTTLPLKTIKDPVTSPAEPIKVSTKKKNKAKAQGSPLGEDHIEAARGCNDMDIASVDNGADNAVLSDKDSDNQKKRRKRRRKRPRSNSEADDRGNGDANFGTTGVPENKPTLPANHNRKTFASDEENEGASYADRKEPQKQQQSKNSVKLDSKITEKSHNYHSDEVQQTWSDDNAEMSLDDLCGKEVKVIRRDRSRKKDSNDYWQAAPHKNVFEHKSVIRTPIYFYGWAERSEGNFKVVDYSKWPTLLNIPAQNDVIAYKVLEMNVDYTPVVSSYREAVVLDCDDAGWLTLKNVKCNQGSQRRVSGRFDCRVEDANEILTNVVAAIPPQQRLLWHSLIEPRRSPADYQLYSE